MLGWLAVLLAASRAYDSRGPRVRAGGQARHDGNGYGAAAGPSRPGKCVVALPGGRTHAAVDAT